MKTTDTEQLNGNGQVEQNVQKGINHGMMSALGEEKRCLMGERLRTVFPKVEPDLRLAHLETVC